MPKVHLIRTALPLKEGADQIADCHRLVPKAKFEVVFDEYFGDVRNLVESSLIYCRQCVREFLKDFDDETKPVNFEYVYGCVAGQEAMVSDEI